MRRRDLETDALSHTRRHHCERAVALQQALNHLGLTPTKLIIPIDFAQHLQGLLRRRRVRIKGIPCAWIDRFNGKGVFGMIRSKGWVSRRRHASRNWQEKMERVASLSDLLRQRKPTKADAIIICEEWPYRSSSSLNKRAIHGNVLSRR